MVLELYEFLIMFGSDKKKYYVIVIYTSGMFADTDDRRKPI